MISLWLGSCLHLLLAATPIPSGYALDGTIQNVCVPFTSSPLPVTGRAAAVADGTYLVHLARPVPFGTIDSLVILDAAGIGIEYLPSGPAQVGP